MIFLGKNINRKKLLSKQELLQYLEENGRNDRVLADIRERYFFDFGNELIWRYPISDQLHMGTFIVLVKEGFLSLPFDLIDDRDYEILELQDIAMFDLESIQYFIDDWQRFSDDLMEAMMGIKNILAG